MSVSDEHFHRIMDSFRNFDKDGDGSINKEELKSVMMKIREEEQDDQEIEEEVEQLFKQMDRDGSGTISYSEFFRAERMKGMDPATTSAISKLSNFFGKSHVEQEEIIKQNEIKSQQQKEEEEEESEEDVMVIETDKRLEEVDPSGSPSGMSQFLKVNKDAERSEELSKELKEIKRKHLHLEQENHQLSVELESAKITIEFLKHGLESVDPKIREKENKVIGVLNFNLTQ